MGKHLRRAFGEHIFKGRRKVPINSVLGEHKSPSTPSLAQEPLIEKILNSLSRADSKPLRECQLLNIS